MSALDRIDDVVGAAGAIVKLAREGGSALAIAERAEALREQLLSTRREMLDLREEIGKLVERLADKARFEDERHKYALVTLATGTHVYVAVGSGEGEPAVMERRQGAGDGADPPPPYLCAHCFGERRREILQPTDNRLEQYCPACKATYQIVKPAEARVYIDPPGSRWDDMF